MNSRKDLPVGIALLIVALLVLWHIQSFPPAPGQPYNAAVFPGIAAVGLGLTAILLIVQSLRAPRDAAPPTRTASTTASDAEGTRDAVTDDTVPPPPAESRMLAIGLTAGAILFYLFTAEFLGFLISSTLILAALMWAYGVRRVLVVPVAISMTLLIHFAFYSFLRVPLPWGLLQSFAW